MGDFDTSEMEHHWKVKVHHTEINKFGWGFIKLEAWFVEPKTKVLVLDSDIIFIGKVLDRLQIFDEEFIVSGDSLDPTHPLINQNYFELKRLTEFDPEYKYPGYVFNTGQIVVTTGIFSRKDMLPFITQGNFPRLKTGDVFKNGEQGFVNYFITKNNKNFNYSIASPGFHYWIKNPKALAFEIKKLYNREGEAYIIHWAGFQKPLYRMVRKDLLLYFQREYYRKIPKGEIKRIWRNLLISILYPIRKLTVLITRIKNKICTSE